MAPRKERNAVGQRKRKARRRPEPVTVPSRSHQRWVKALGAGTLALCPVSLAVGVLAALPGPPHASFLAASETVRPDPQYAFGFLTSHGVGTTGHGGIGVTGKKAKSSHPSAAVVRDAGNLADHAAKPGLPHSKLGIPAIVLAAYTQAANTMAGQQPGCHLPWWLLAGIGKVESDHADNGLVDSRGNTLVPILGPPLNGTGGDAAITAPGGGWERAVGPMQFLPSTWQVWGGGGNLNNVFDAALAAGRYLCAGGLNLSGPAQQADAVFSYNPSDSYVQLVLMWAYAYASGVVPAQSAGLPTGSGGQRTGGGPASGGAAARGSGSSGSRPGGSGSGGSHSGGSGTGGSGAGGSGSTGSGSGGSGGPGSGGSPSPSPSPAKPAPTPSPSPSPSPTRSATASSSPATASTP